VLQESQPEAKIKLVPVGLERNRLLDLFGGLKKSTRVIECKADFLDGNNQKGSSDSA
jgi:hypothetical protein